MVVLHKIVGTLFSKNYDSWDLTANDPVSFTTGVKDYTVYLIA
jgi:hypothetical protein